MVTIGSLSENYPGGSRAVRDPQRSDPVAASLLSAFGGEPVVPADMVALLRRLADDVPGGWRH